MVDVVSPHIMPSESEVLVARCFLTKILRSSMRKNRFKGKNDLSSRPHSWHSQKLTEEEPDPFGKETTPVAVWNQKEARLKESSCQTDRNKQHMQTGQLSLESNMERLERPVHPFPLECVSPTKYTGSSEIGTEGKRDTFICFSSDSNTLVLDSNSPGRKGTSVENIFFKGFQGEGHFTVERPEYLQMLYQKGSQLEEQNSSWCSSRFRPSVGSVWQVPEKRKTKPPPPHPTMRNDSCATSRVFPYLGGSEKNPNNHRRSFESFAEWSKSHPEKNSKSRCSITSLSEKDILHPSRADEHNQLHPNKHFSLSSTDVRQFHYTNRLAHQKQYSDESNFHLQTAITPHTKIQSVGSYYRSLQDLPMNASNRKFVECSSASMDAANLEEDRYSTSVNKKGKHQMPHTENKGHNGFIKNIYLLKPQGSEHLQCLGPKDATERSDGHINNMKRIFPAHQSSNHKMSVSRLNNPWVPQDDQEQSPLNTSLLLAQEHRIQTDVTSMSNLSSRNVYDSISGKGSRRGDRYATTLRNEVRQKRAQLQKSCSAATLTYDVQNDDLSDWNYNEPSKTCCISLSNTYKDNLKEAQVRVLQATSFQRRGLEPLGTEAAVQKASNGRIKGRKRYPLAKRMHSFSEPDKIDRVGVEREHQDAPFDQMKFSHVKPAISKMVMPMSGEPSETKENCLSGEAQDTHPARQPGCLTPSEKEVPLEQQKLGTFAEYQATWNKQKRASEPKIQGRYYSAENILDNETEEVAAYIHERSRSSPSADICTQNIPTMWNDPQAKQSNYSARTESNQQSSSDAVKQNVAVSSGPCNLRPVPGAQEPTQPPQVNAVSPSKPHLGTESTSLPQDFLSGAPKDPMILQPLSSLDTTTKTLTSPDCSQLYEIPQSDRRPGDIESKKEQSASSSSLSVLAVKRSHSPPPLLPSLRERDRLPVASVLEDAPLWSEKDCKLSEAVIDVSNSGRKCIGVVSANPAQDSGTSVVLKTHSDSISMGANEIWPPSTITQCKKQTTRDQQPELEQLKVKESIPVENLTGDEDAKTQQLVRDIMGKDKSLVEILDQSGRKTTMDLMEGLFPQERQILEVAHQRRRTSIGSRLPTTSRRDEDDISAAASLVPSSSYYNTSAPKAELLIKMKDMQEQLLEQDSEDELDVDLATKKELISSLAKKLEVLREARQSLQEDVEDNEALGSEVESTVQRVCQPNQLDKFRMFVGDLDKVVSLLLSLSGRLARVENALNSLENAAPTEEKRTLTEKRKLLMQQHEDAKELKENLDRRERLVSSIMEAHLDPEQLDDYRHFVKMKSALIIEQRKLEDKIKLGEEQLKCLIDSVPLEQRLHF
ncbi:protein Shroom2-like isoform X2 [Corythoichthys intestinalis]|uniref:protein Shroom2-like isoform X2 n=1 Tax=Corythoichthys intestinalis TaxID=161448 RepID=UPI0025A68AF4|nr:protein Shroom2-like isoform X2 [Corythoichthys intestinalis]